MCWGCSVQVRLSISEVGPSISEVRPSAIDVDAGLL